MPILNVKVSHPAGPELIGKIADLLLDATTRVLRKRRDLTSIAIDCLPPEQWVVAGTTLAAQNKSSFYVDIKIVDGTNTKDEKAQYVAQVFDAFEKLLGNLHPESYIHVHDVRADAYGFGGLTQEYRYIRSQT